MSGPRFSDAKLEEFHQEFMAHRDLEDKERQQQREMYEALFRQEDLAKNIGPGVVQLMVRLSDDVKALRVAADRQKNFIGGVLFAITSIWFFVSDIVPNLVQWIKKTV